ncbi:hypothetical protein [Nocardiopsis tropica]|uniref:TPR repeat domain-containing protein n=1 Tax=Nocardiopsis tropica TaxID=109330 RepID=A0ABV1ZT94_9ACTN
MSARGVTYSGATTEAVMVGSYTLEMHYDPPMKVSEIRAGAEDINMLERRLLGRAEGMDEDFDSAAKEFTEVVKWDISTVSASDLATWMEVASSLRFCAAVTEEWADHVSTYKRERLRIINRWNDEAPAHEADLEDTEAVFQFVGQKTPAEKAGEALSALKEELESEEATAYGELESRSTEIMNDLKDGPTPEAVQRLIESGYVTWSYFNLGGDVETMPIDADPDEMADEVVEYLADPEGYDGDINEIVALLNNFGYVAVDRQNNGGTLTSEELAFLTDFYDALEEAGGTAGEHPGVLGVSHSIAEHNGIPSEQAEDLLGALGGGLLVLSDESLLGGYDKLPESVRNVVEGPDPEGSYDRLAWYPQMEPLTHLMEHANAELRGGEQFSVNLTQTVANELDVRNPDPDDEDDNRGNPLFFNNDAEILIGVSTRNEDANHAILTGEGPYEHPVHGLDSAMTVRALYTYNWPDDGATASELTNWIWEQSDGAPHEQERAGEAMAGLVDLFADPHFVNALSGTGYPVEGQIVDANGRTVDMVWEDASAGHLNSKLAWEWSELFSTHIDGFASEYGTPLADQGSGNDTTYWDPEHGLMLNPDARTNFVQQIMGDGDAASRVYTETLVYGHESLGSYTGAPGEDGFIPTDSAAQSGVLRGLVDVALEAEAERREENSDAAANYQNKVTGYAVDMFGAMLSEVPVPGSATAAEAFKIASKEEFNVEAYAAEQRVDNNTGEWEIQETVKLRMVQEIAMNDPAVMETLNASIPGLVQTDANGEYYIPASRLQWEVSPNEYSDTLRNAWQVASANGTITGGGDPDDAVEEYVSAYNTARGKINE